MESFIRVAYRESMRHFFFNESVILNDTWCVKFSYSIKTVLRKYRISACDILINSSRVFTRSTFPHLLFIFVSIFFFFLIYVSLLYAIQLFQLRN